jgi:hypothetical protein
MTDRTDRDYLRRPFEALAEDIRHAATGHRVVYVPNPGNRGDALIRYGTKLFLEDIGLRHEEVNIAGRWGRSHLAPFLLQRGTPVLFLLGGGGAWSKAYGGAYQVARTLSRVTHRLFVLPSTYEFPPDGVRGTLYRRDEFESRAQAPMSRFCHDMAFYALLHADRLGFARTPISEDVGVHFRLDLETRFAREDLPANNVDISAQGDHMSLADEFLRTLARRRLIVTDRLHVAVGGLIAGRPVRLAAGHYFKIRAIHATSIVPGFADRVTLMPETMTPAEIARTAPS